MRGSIGYIATEELRALFPPGARLAAVYDPSVGPAPGPSNLPDFDQISDGDFASEQEPEPESESDSHDSVQDLTLLNEGECVPAPDSVPDIKIPPPRSGSWTSSDPPVRADPDDPPQTPEMSAISRLSDIILSLEGSLSSFQRDVSGKMASFQAQVDALTPGQDQPSPAAPPPSASHTDMASQAGSLPDLMDIQTGKRGRPKSLSPPPDRNKVTITANKFEALASGGSKSPPSKKLVGRTEAEIHLPHTANKKKDKKQRGSHAKPSISRPDVTTSDKSHKSNEPRKAKH